MNLSKQKMLLILISILFLLSLSVLGYFLIVGDKTNIEYRDHYSSFDDGWTLTLNENTTENVSLPTQVTTHSPESVVFTKTLPSGIKENMALITRNYHQWLRVKIDGDEIFSYPNADWNGFCNLISDEWCLVEIKPEYAGKTIEVSLENTSAPVFKFSAHVGEFYYGTDNALVSFVKHQGFWGLILGIIISGIGALLLIVSFIYRGHTKQSTNTAMGIAFFCFGVWIINRVKMSVFPNHSTYVYWLSLMCLMLVAPFLFLYSYYRNNIFKKFALFAFRFCIAADLFLILASFFINFSVEYITPVSYFLSVLAMLLTSYSLFRGGWGKESKLQSKIDRRLDRAEFFSTLIYPTLGLIEVIKYSDKLWTEWSMPFMFGMTIYAIIYFGFILWRTFLVVKDRTNVTKQLHDSQLELMMGQIQPHFMFNTLSSIRTLIKVDPDVAYDMVYNFSNYLRANVDNMTNLNGIPIASEVQHIKSYVEIEKVRLGDRLVVEYDIHDDDFIVPPLSIQPLVENAIKHGIRKKIGGGTVYLKSYAMANFDVVEVSDDGIGFNQADANRVFGTFADESSVLRGETTQINMELMRSVMESLELYDADGNRITVRPVKPEDQAAEISSTPASTDSKHKSSGLTNVLIRLREMSNAKIEITSREGEGTTMKVYFPKK